MSHYKLCVYVPETHTEQVKQALFAAGAGRIGNYECCSFQLRGQGQFRPLDGSAPFIGKQGEIETVVEDRVEMICDADHLKAAVAALRKAHPYEEPAFDILPLVDIESL